MIIWKKYILKFQKYVIINLLEKILKLTENINIILPLLSFYSFKVSGLI